MNLWDGEAMISLKSILCLICEVRNGDGFALTDIVHCGLNMQPRKDGKVKRHFSSLSSGNNQSSGKNLNSELKVQREFQWAFMIVRNTAGRS